jgi:hypothetical protein
MGLTRRVVHVFEHRVQWSAEKLGIQRGCSTWGHVITRPLELCYLHGMELSLPSRFVNYRSELLQPTRVYIYQRIALSEAKGRMRARVAWL